MSWVIKRGRFDYVFAGSVFLKTPGDWAVEWTDDQTLAHRFGDRNVAANIVGHMPATEDARVVRLVPRAKEADRG